MCMDIIESLAKKAHNYYDVKCVYIIYILYKLINKI